MSEFNPTYETAADVLAHFDVRENVGLSTEEVNDLFFFSACKRSRLSSDGTWWATC